MWQSSMVINLTSPDLNQRVSETFASTLGIVISFVAVAASILIATMMDFFRKKMKLCLDLHMQYTHKMKRDATGAAHGARIQPAENCNRCGKRR